MSRATELSQAIQEAKKPPFEVYHKTFSASMREMEKFADKKKFEIDQTDYDNKVTHGPGKPSVGKTVKFTLGLIKDDKEQKKKIHVQVFGMDSGSFELNMYIS